MNQPREGTWPVAMNWRTYWIGAATIVVLYLIAVNAATTIWPKKTGRRAVSPDGLYTATLELSTTPVTLNCDVRLRLSRHRPDWFLAEFDIERLDLWSDFDDNAFRLKWISNNELHIGDRYHRVSDGFRLKVHPNSITFEHSVESP